MGRRKWLLAAAGAVAAVAVGFGAAMAQSGEDVTGTSFLDRVAAKLGIDAPKLEQAIEDARSEELDEAVTAGDLTQEQAGRLKERLDELPGEALGAGPGFGFALKFREGGPGGIGVCAGFDHEELATFLGVTAQQLAEELQAEGATLATVAEAHGKSRDELKAFITGEAKAKLDAAVAAGDLKQERADEILARLEENVDELIDNEMPGFGRPGRFFRDAVPPLGDEDGSTPNQGGELRPAFRS